MRCPEGMVEVSIDPDVLSNKLCDDNILVCAQCRERQKEFGDFSLSGRGGFYCPRSCNRDHYVLLTEEVHMPQLCVRKFEHLMVWGRYLKRLEDEQCSG